MIALAALILGAATMPFGVIVWVLAVPLTWWLVLRDSAKTKAVLFYDVNDGDAAWFDELVSTGPG